MSLVNWPMATHAGRPPVAGALANENVPPRLPSRTLTPPLPVMTASGRPSPFTSPTVMLDSGLTFAVVNTRGRNVPSPTPGNTVRPLNDTPQVSTARSGMPSPVKSVAASVSGRSATARSGAATSVPSPLPSNMLTVPTGPPDPTGVPASAVTTSAAPSPLKSPTATPTVPSPAV